MRATAVVLAAVFLAGGVLAVAGPKDAAPGKPITALGILTQMDNKKDVVIIWVDGDDAPTKFVLGEDFDRNTLQVLPAKPGGPP